MYSGQARDTFKEFWELFLLTSRTLLRSETPWASENWCRLRRMVVCL